MAAHVCRPGYRESIGKPDKAAKKGHWGRIFIVWLASFWTPQEKKKNETDIKGWASKNDVGKFIVPPPN